MTQSFNGRLHPLEINMVTLPVLIELMESSAISDHVFGDFVVRIKM